MVARSSSSVESANNGKLSLNASVVCLNDVDQGNTVSSRKNLSLLDRFAAVDFIKKGLYKNSSS
jgi:hypothetical protein